MKTPRPSYELGIQLDRNWVTLKAQLDPDGAQRLNESFDLVYGIARGEIKRVALALLKPIVFGISVAEAPAVKTADCFKVGDYIFVFRDPDFDNWLPKAVSAVGSGTALTFELTKELNFKEIAEAHLGIPRSLDELANLLIEKQKTWGLKQIEDIILACERGTNPFELQTNGYVNLFFIEADGVVFAIGARRDSHGWRVHVRRFGYVYRCLVGLRVLFRNC